MPYNKSRATTTSRSMREQDHENVLPRYIYLSFLQTWSCDDGVDPDQDTDLILILVDLGLDRFLAASNYSGIRRSVPPNFCLSP